MGLHFKPLYDNYTENKMLVVNTHCNQVFGLFKGWVETDEGRVEFCDLLAFIEHAVNRWWRRTEKRRGGPFGGFFPALKICDRYLDR